MAPDPLEFLTPLNSREWFLTPLNSDPFEFPRMARDPFEFLTPLNFLDSFEFLRVCHNRGVLIKCCLSGMVRA